MVKFFIRADNQQTQFIAKRTSEYPADLPVLNRFMGGLTAILAPLLLFSACSVTLPELPSVPFISSTNNQITISGELTYAERAALYTGSVATLVICNDSAAADCGEVVAQQTMRVGGLRKPLPFAIAVDAGKMLVGSEYSLWVTVTGTTGRVSWITVEPFTINANSADTDSVEYSLGLVNMVRPDAFGNSLGQSAPSIATQN